MFSNTPLTFGRAEVVGTWTASEPGSVNCSVLPWTLANRSEGFVVGCFSGSLSSNSVHIHCDNLNVVRHVERLRSTLDGHRPFSLIKDGDLLSLSMTFCLKKGVHSVEVKGHADDKMVLLGLLNESKRMVMIVQMILLI